MTEAAARQAIDTILARDGLRLMPDEYTRLVQLYAELQPQLAQLRIPELPGLEPAVIFLAQ